MFHYEKHTQRITKQVTVIKLHPSESSPTQITYDIKFASSQNMYFFKRWQFQ